mgnify:CR=1 FL=1
MDDTASSSPLQALHHLGKQRLSELKKLVDQLIVHMPPRDLVTLLFPPALGLDLLRGTLSGKAFEEDIFDKDGTDRELMEAVFALALWLSRHYFSTTIHDVHKFPGGAPCLIVGNHSAGLMPLDALFAMNAIREQWGTDRIVYSLVHDFAYMAPKVARNARRMGVLRAKRENALAALDAGGHVLVYPGGDRDAFRRFADRKKIVLAQRRGFIRTALQAGVPIVPLVSVGLHEAFFVLSDGQNLARKLGLKKALHTDVMPISISFPWGLVPAFAPYIPLPCAIEMQFCDPIVAQGSPDDEALVDDIYNRVETVMQQTMDTLYEHRLPLIGR